MKSAMEAKLARAAALEHEAAQLRSEAFEQRRLPDFWRVGQKVRYLTNSDWAWHRGNEGTVVALRDDCKGKPAHEYQVFYTGVGPDCYGQYWTTPSDVELIEDTPSDIPAT